MKNTKTTRKISNRRKKKKNKNRPRGTFIPHSVMSSAEMKVAERYSKYAHKTVHVGLDGVHFLDQLLDPLGQGTGLGPKQWPVHVPDGSPGVKRMGITETFRYSMPAGTATSCVVAIDLPNQTVQHSTLLVHHGAGDVFGAGAPNTTIRTNSEETWLVGQLLSVSSKYRVISIGLRVKDTGPKETSSGTVSLYFSTNQLQTGAAAWDNFNLSRSLRIEETRLVSKGATARIPFDIQTPFASIPAQYSDAVGVTTIPHFYITGIHASSVLTFEAVVHFELIEGDVVMPFPLMSLGVEPEYRSLVAYANTQEFLVSGDSFWSFLKKIGKGIGSAFTFIDNTVQRFTPLFRALKGTASTLSLI